MHIHNKNCCAFVEKAFFFLLQSTKQKLPAKKKKGSVQLNANFVSIRAWIQPVLW